jgi:hypothetical protein
MIGDAPVAVEKIEPVAEDLNPVDELGNGDGAQENAFGIEDIELEHIGGPEIGISIALDDRARLVAGPGDTDALLGLDLPAIGDHPDVDMGAGVRPGENPLRPLGTQQLPADQEPEDLAAEDLRQRS